jgi:hypothetical protein
MSWATAELRSEVAGLTGDVEIQGDDIENQGGDVEIQSDDFENQGDDLEVQGGDIENQGNDIETQCADVENQGDDLEIQPCGRISTHERLRRPPALVISFLLLRVEQARLLVADGRGWSSLFSAPRSGERLAVMPASDAEP